MPTLARLRWGLSLPKGFLAHSIFTALRAVSLIAAARDEELLTFLASAPM
jgi:hypothetical protein